VIDPCPVQWPECSRCEQPVKAVEWWKDEEREEFVLTLTCHGEREERRFRLSDIVDAPEMVRPMVFCPAFSGGEA
jgi:hypothetical protein